MKDISKMSPENFPATIYLYLGKVKVGSIIESFGNFTHIVSETKPRVMELADIEDLKSSGLNSPCGFKSRPWD